jgi:hypothetical protein
MNRRIQKYIEKYKNFSKPQLETELLKLNESIDACHKYINAACNTFLGPLGALSVIKDCQSRIDAINFIIKKQGDIDV